MIQPLIVQQRGPALAGYVHQPVNDPGNPCVVLCHGLLSSMESPKMRLLAGALTSSGFTAFRFDFRGCGKSEGDIRDTTVSGRVTDLLAVLDHIRENLHFTGPIGLLGSSLGGYVSMLTFPKREGIKAICVWAAPFDPTALSEKRNHPDLDVLRRVFFEDLSRLDLKGVSHLIHHVLIIHGAQDEVIPKEQAHFLFDWVSEPKSLQILPGVNHRFSDEHLRNRALQLSVQWFGKHLH